MYSSKVLDWSSLATRHDRFDETKLAGAFIVDLERIATVFLGARTGEHLAADFEDSVILPLDLFRCTGQ